MKLGLVDALGSLQDAITSAALLADVKHYDVIYMEKKLSPKEMFINQLLQDAGNTLAAISGGINLDLGPLSHLSDETITLLTMSKSPGIYLECLSCNITP